MRHLLLITSIIFSTSVCGQTQNDIPFIGDFGGYGVHKIIKSDSLGDLVIPNIDTNIIIFISKNLTDYKMYDRQNRLISEGDLGGRKYVDYCKRFGKWTTYFSSGQPKVIGYYYANQPTGLWKYFYSNGQLKQMYSLAQIETDSFALTCKVGLYEEYFENGQLKVNGFYKTSFDTITIQVYDYSLGNFKDTLIRGSVSKQYGIWNYYKENGELQKKDEHY